MLSQFICDVLRAVMMLSYASLANCLAIMSCCEVCVVAMASPKTPSRLTIPTVSTTIEITTSSNENPASVFRPARTILLRVTIDAAIDTLRPSSGTVAIRELVPSRPTYPRPANSAHSPIARDTPRHCPGLPSNFPRHLQRPAPSHPGKNKMLLPRPRCCSPYNRSQSHTIRCQNPPRPPSKPPPIALGTSHP